MDRNPDVLLREKLQFLKLFIKSGTKRRGKLKSIENVFTQDSTVVKLKKS